MEESNCQPCKFDNVKFIITMAEARKDEAANNMLWRVSDHYIYIYIYIYFDKNDDDVTTVSF